MSPTLPTKPFSYGTNGRDSSSVPAIRNGIVGVNHVMTVASTWIPFRIVISSLERSTISLRLALRRKLDCIVELNFLENFRKQSVFLNFKTIHFSKADEFNEKEGYREDRRILMQNINALETDRKRKPTLHG